MPLDERTGDHDARLRKRERDKENQRQKRLREKEHLSRLQQRVRFLEDELNAIKSGDRAPNHDLWDVVTRLRARNEVLERRMHQIQALLADDHAKVHGQNQSPGTLRGQHDGLTDFDGDDTGVSNSPASVDSIARGQ